MWTVSLVAGGSVPPLELGPFKLVEFKDNGAVYAETYPAPPSHFGIGQIIAEKEPDGWLKAGETRYQSCAVKCSL